MSVSQTVEERQKGAAAYWDSFQTTRAAQPSPPTRIRWIESPHIVAHVNRNICGRPLEGELAGLTAVFKERAKGSLPLKRGISVGCGPAFKEMNLLKQGIVEHFDLFDISAELLNEGRRVAGEWGLSDRANFILADAFTYPIRQDYDLVYWDNALHHMFDAIAAVEWSKKVLAPGGWFLMNDYVGASRFQWPNIAIWLISAVRHLLPKKYLRNPFDPNSPYFPSSVPRPTLEFMEYDPSEAADSDAIIPAIRKEFPDAWIKHVGGTIYHITLNDIMTNIPDRSLLLKLLMRLDDLTSFIPHYAVAIARKGD